MSQTHHVHLSHRRKVLLTIAAIAAPTILACQGFSDTVAFRNGTQSALTVTVEIEGDVLAYVCDGGGPNAQRFDGTVTMDLEPETRMCLEGPLIESPDETYDARDIVIRVEAQRDGEVCLNAEGTEIHDQFMVDGFYKTMTISNEQCPGDETAETSEEEGEQDEVVEEDEAAQEEMWFEF